MHYDTWYEVKTHWGWFRLDAGAYRDYLEGRLWITWKPGKSQEPQKIEETAELMPTDISEEAVKLRDMAGRYGVYNTLQNMVPGEQVVVPYKPRMSSLSIDEMNLSVRSSNGLMRAGASTFGKLRDLMGSEHGLRGVRNLGSKSEKEINVAFISACYQQLNSTEKAAFWQKVLDASVDTGKIIGQQKI